MDTHKAFTLKIKLATYCKNDIWDLDESLKP